MPRLVSKLCLMIGVILMATILQAHAKLRDDQISYKEFLMMRSKSDVVVLDAAQLEKYFMVVPENMAKQGKGISQKQLDSLLVSLIPTKDTKVILYCYQNFMPTRNMPASTSVAMSLEANGYKNVQELEYLWTNGRSHAHAQVLGDKEVIPYAKKIPENVFMENRSESNKR